MKQFVITSGKGGTGKTSLTAAFAHLASHEVDAFNSVLVDTDVDAANLELVLTPEVISRQDFWGGKIAIINQESCNQCGDCIKVCRFDAISISNIRDQFEVDPIACDGCAACVYECPTGSIDMQDQIAGEWIYSLSRYGPFFYANLRPGQENSGKLVTLVKQKARLLALEEDIELVMVDGPPGIGCPVISSISGADLTLVVAEPTIAGVHDMQRILQTSEHFNVTAMVCINKADLSREGTDEIKHFCNGANIHIIGEIPFDIAVAEAIVAGEPITAYKPEAPASIAIRKIWTRVIEIISEGP